MYYRRKLILGILEQFGGTLSHTRLQKILFLVTRQQEKKAFDFVPYKYGSFSFQANQDLQTMIKYDLVENKPQEFGEAWVNVAKETFFNLLNSADKSAIKTVKRQTADMDSNTLVRYTYINYPFYATKSQIAERLLSKEELEKVQAQKRSIKEPTLFTIGYEGISLETYLNKLIINDVKVLCDVRKNPISMKYGFSKKQLQNACESIGIKYVHIPDLGIVSDKRKKLETQRDYNKLFAEYEKTTLLENEEALNEVEHIIAKHNRVALTCFEKDQCMCHRGRIVQKLSNQDTFEIPIKHL
jgi:uncharacterized protein (DUF488 family)